MQATSSQERRLVRTSTPGIYRKANRYVVVVRDADGKQRKKSCKTLAEARTKRAELIDKAAKGEELRESKLTVRAYFETWIDSYAGRTRHGLRDNTRDGYRQMMEAHVLPALGHVRLSRLRQRHLRELATVMFGKGLKRNTVRLAVAPLRAMLATAVADGEIQANPAIGYRLPQPPTPVADEPERAKALTENELRKLLAALPERRRLLFELMAHTGLRIGEVLALQWQHIDFGRRRVLVRRRWYRGSFGPPKSRYGKRDVPITEGMARELWELRKQTKAGDDALVFPSSVGTPMDLPNLRKVFAPAAKAAGVPWATFHTLRHTCATMLFRHGLNPKQVQGWLGHHAASFTMDTYVHLLPDDLPDADFLDGLTGASVQLASGALGKVGEDGDENVVPDTEHRVAEAL
jgi:integrase